MESYRLLRLGCSLRLHPRLAKTGSYEVIDDIINQNIPPRWAPSWTSKMSGRRSRSPSWTRSKDSGCKPEGLRLK
ncbi:MAG: hypothetical protein WEB89_01735 [Balneolales bacterium]